LPPLPPYIDWNFDEDRSRIHTGHGPENVSRLRRFAVGIQHHFSDGKTSIAKKMAHLNRNIRLVFDYLRMTRNSVGNVQAGGGAENRFTMPFTSGLWHHLSPGVLLSGEPACVGYGALHP
jgi:hypothetical protein